MVGNCAQMARKNTVYNNSQHSGRSSEAQRASDAGHNVRRAQQKGRVPPDGALVLCQRIRLPFVSDLLLITFRPLREGDDQGSGAARAGRQGAACDARSEAAILLCNKVTVII